MKHLWVATAWALVMSATATAHFVFAVPEGGGQRGPLAAQADGSPPRAMTLRALPEPTSSFGAAVADGWLYVYGGHVSPTHAYSTSAVSGHFARRRLRD